MYCLLRGTRAHGDDRRSTTDGVTVTLSAAVARRVGQPRGSQPVLYDGHHRMGQHNKDVVGFIHVGSSSISHPMVMSGARTLCLTAVNFLLFFPPRCHCKKEVG